MLQANYATADDNASKAAVNAYYRNKQYKHTYTSAQHTLAQCALDILHTAYKFTSSYINYRKTFIAVKIAGHAAYNKATAKQAISILEQKGYTVVVTQQGLIVRIKC